MYEIIVRVLRAVACHPRLRILAHLAREQEVAPTRLAGDLGMPVDLACAHLAKLTAAGLIQRRRSGLWCYCRAQSPYDKSAFSGRLAQWLFALLRQSETVSENPVVEQLRDSPSPEEAVRSALFEAATAFDNVRRLQIMRLVWEKKSVSADSLVEALSMSRSSVSRHVDKLVRRGYLVAQRQERTLRYGMPQEFRSPVHEELWMIVAAEWEKRRLDRSRS